MALLAESTCHCPGPANNATDPIQIRTIRKRDDPCRNPIELVANGYDSAW